jgi:dipeptidyl aminopeptidase/acylaminoacyl peptidase
MTLWVTDIESKEREEILAFSWDIITGRISEDGETAVLIVNRDGFSELHIIDTKDNSPKMSPVETGGVVYDQCFSKDSRFLYYLCDSATSSPNIFMIDLNTKETEQLTYSMCEKVNSNDLSEAKVLRFISYDGLQVPGIFYPPKNVQPNEKAPAIVWVHGGPGGQSLPRYSPEIQFIANHGYAIYAVNNRGSSGYGKSFFKAADHKHGEADLDDCVAAAKYLATLDFIDEERIGINGGSYGGFMVLAALAFRPKEFRVGTDFFGVSNWVRTLKEVPAWWKAIKDLLYTKIGNPFEEEEYLKSISPLFHADKIKRPLLVLQGVNDPRVLKIESDEIVERLEEHGVPVEYVVFDDEGHGFKKKANRIRGANAMLAFLDKYLR